MAERTSRENPHDLHNIIGSHTSKEQVVWTGATRNRVTNCIFSVHRFRDCPAHHLTRRRSTLTLNENFDSLLAFSQLGDMWMFMCCHSLKRPISIEKWHVEVNFNLFELIVTRSQVTRWNPLKGFTKSSCRKSRLRGTLPASNSRKG
jgi:hypothetical protein